MFGALIRAAVGGACGAFIGVLLGWVIPMFVDVMRVEATEDNLLVRSFTAVGEHAVAIIILSMLMGVIAAAAAEGRLGRPY